MINKLRARMQDEKGFTLIELLVVILIIGILAAIALPAFLNQREKAQDTEAKSGARTAQTAIETMFTENQTYVGASTTTLPVAEPALGQLGTRLTVSGVTADAYTVSVKSKAANGRTWVITRAANGAMTRTCVAGTGSACPAIPTGATSSW